MSCGSSEEFSSEKWSDLISRSFETDKAAAAFFGVSLNTIYNWRYQISEPRARHLTRARRLVAAGSFLDAVCGEP